MWLKLLKSVGVSGWKVVAYMCMTHSIAILAMLDRLVFAVLDMLPVLSCC